MNKLRPAFVASMIPLWLEEETRYAVVKHGTANPQRTALSGGLSKGGTAYNDLASYYKRFSIFYGEAEERDAYAEGLASPRKIRKRRTRIT